MAINFQPVLVGGALGAVDDVLENADLTASPPRTQMAQQWSFWYEAVLLGGSILLDMSQAGFQLRWITEPGAIVGAALLGRRASRAIREQQAQGAGVALPRARAFTRPAVPSGNPVTSAHVPQRSGSILNV